MGCCFRVAQPSSFPFSLPPRCISATSTTILCCSNGPADFTSSSSSRGWYNPNRTLTSPDIVRHWVTADLDTPLQSQERFKVVSYNILGDKNAFKHRDMYRNVPLIYLKWDYRKRVICEELIGWDPDIICLQEVDKYYDLLSIMKKAGYLGSYKRRTGDYVDGCAMFWKAEKFRLLEEESIEFKQIGLRDNVAQLSVFEMCRAASKRVLVGNIHVLYNPRRGDIKLGQIGFLASRADFLSKKWDNAPVVLAGDYNSTPQSAIYKFLSTSELDIMAHDRRELSGQRNCPPSQALGLKRENGSLFVLMDRFKTIWLNTNNFRLWKYSWTEEEVKNATGSTNCCIVTTHLKLNSSYAVVKSSSRMRSSCGEPLVTSYHSKFLGTVDYLWYTNGLLPTKVLDTLPINVLRKTGGLPCKKLGSDHLALVSEFAFTQGKEEDKQTTISGK